MNEIKDILTLEQYFRIRITGCRFFNQKDLLVYGGTYLIWNLIILFENPTYKYTFLLAMALCLLTSVLSTAF